MATFQTPLENLWLEMVLDIIKEMKMLENKLLIILTTNVVFKDATMNCSSPEEENHI